MHLPALWAQALGLLAQPVVALRLTDWPPFPHNLSGHGSDTSGLLWVLNGLLVVKG